MSDMGKNEPEEIHSKVLRAGRRTYFFDVRSTKADDYYLTITESKKHTNAQGETYYKKHKIYLYKEDFEDFRQLLGETTDYIIRERGSEVISDRHQPDFQKKHKEKVDLEQELEQEKSATEEDKTPSEERANTYTDVSFDDI